MTISKSNFKKIAVAAAFAGDSKKAEPVTIYDLAGKSPLADYAVLMVVESAPQLDAVEEEVQVRLKHEGIYCLHRDGMNSKNWKVLDYGGVLVHIYDGKAAEFYAIDKVYADYKTVEWEEKPEPKPEMKAERKPEPKPEPKPAAPAAKKAAEKKPAAKKPAVKKAVAKKPVARKPAAKKPALKKAPAKKAAVKKVPFKKTVKKTAPLKKMVKKAKPAGKAPVKKAKSSKKTAKKTAKKK